ncbi:MAG: four helix bundle protein [Deltaproteobacteria bacterium]|nr:four helix bundle protein [Deltaproteobacteria bacterium]
MAFNHTKLAVYQHSLDGLELCDRICNELPTGRRNVRDQMDRAATSVVAKIAEGAGEFSPREKARFYRMACRSAVEVAAWLDVCLRRKEADLATAHAALSLYDEITAMLVSLSKRSKGRGVGRG